KNGINFGSGSEVSVNKIAKVIIEKSGINNNQKLEPKYVESRPVEVQRLFADITRAKELLNFKPMISFENGIEMLIEWYKNFKSELWTF
ncbi:MAG: GDP-mannose 4,6-dehydratase, partial [Nitrososphaeraceae archaeon]